MNKFAVIGNPIAHSLSPQIHQSFATETNITISYERLLSNLLAFQKDVTEFFYSGGKGLNVTAPFKRLAFHLAHEKSARAILVKASNTLMQLDDGRIFADNTDGVGLIRDLETRLHLSIEGKSLLIIGAGGAVHGILGSLLEKSPASCWLANRTYEHALNIQQLFSSIKVCSLQQLPQQTFDLVIHATSASICDEILNPSFVSMNRESMIYDLRYGEMAHSFLNICQQNGLKNTFDGRGMLIEQAAESFYLWNKIRPNTSGLIQKIF